ncbi:membrane lipoprotein [Serratia phage vB_SmaM-Kashira]|nr:hypothetical protein [Acinetobacter phage ABPH49]URC22669.1 membrane lipoprotein [Serratia phage vB_SmaM-Kashira]
MKKYLVALLITFSLAGCAKPEAPPAPVRVVQVKDLTPPPDIALMQPLPPKTKLEHGMTDGEILGVMRNNNIRSNTVENNAEALQQYVCNLFPDGSAGPVCKK